MACMECPVDYNTIKQRHYTYFQSFLVIVKQRPIWKVQLWPFNIQTLKKEILNSI